ncbi:MFS transporter [uncultured Thiodictyon sp.]|uniref:MFS transporter n=1 Tax=uncultured Thiodictyon sp. TaxID=1846217 RepID=UPI0025F243D1|nr:MFS transporter [uncultured Thiodictyon sp.]
MATRSADLPSAWSPFSYRAFTVLWTATVISNIGTGMNTVGASWLMTTLAPDPLMVALVQVATMAPAFLLALPSGALADIFDRRRLLLAVNALMALVAATLAALVATGRIDTRALLFCTFLLGMGASFISPAWLAIVPQLVPRPALGQAIALNSMGINVSRAIGPALAGVLIVELGFVAPFAVNALSFLVIAAALAWWRPTGATHSTLPAEGLGEAMRNGLRFALHSAPLRATLVRGIAFFLFASAYWALLPIIAKDSLGGGARLYGLLMGCVGVGAVLGALLLPHVKPRLGGHGTVVAGSLGTALVLAVFSLIANPTAAALASLLGGISWLFVLSTLQVSAQLALPNWVRARGLSIFLTLFFGSMALGSVIWGKTASVLGVDEALLIAAVGALLGVALTWRVRVGEGDVPDVAPSMHWPPPLILLDRPQDRGPVMTAIEYRIDPSDTPAFLALMAQLAQSRRRLGVIQWWIMEDAAAPGLYVEYFVEGSWLAHLRHHERVAGTDRLLQARIHALHRGDQPPAVRHLLAPPVGSTGG